MEQSSNTSPRQIESAESLLSSPASTQIVRRPSNDLDLSTEREATAKNENASEPTLSRDDLEELGLNVAAPIASIPGVIELSEEAQDLIASDNQSLTEEIASQAMEQSDEDDFVPTTASASRSNRVGALAIGGCIIGAVLVAIVRRIRRRSGKPVDKSSQRAAGSARGSKQGPGSVRSTGSPGLKAGGSRSNSRRVIGSTTSTQGARREGRSGTSRARSAAALTAGDKADPSSSAHNGASATAATSATKGPDMSPATAGNASPEVLPARKKRVPPLISGNKARGRSDKEDEEVTSGGGTPDTAPDAYSSAAAATEIVAAVTSSSSPSSAQGGLRAAHAPDPAAGPATASALPDVRLNADAAVFRPRSIMGAGQPTESAANAADPEKSVQERMAATANDANSAEDTSATPTGEEQPAPRSSSQIESLKFNVDAPEFHPASSAAQACAEADANAPGGSLGADPPAEHSKDAGMDVQADVVAGATESQMDEDDAEGAEFQHRPLQLAGKDITADAEETADEKQAAQRLLEIAKELQSMGSGQATPDELRETGLKELKADVNFCVSQQCRPLKVAEHASTAADFFFQLETFDAADEMLDIGIQAARMAGDTALETTLTHNLAASLRKRGKFNMALALHRRIKANIEEREGITSEFVMLARHNIVDLLTTRGRTQECREYLDTEGGKLETHAAKVLGEREEAQAADSDAKDAEAALALQAVARCKLDYAKHYEASQQPDDAIAVGRAALAQHRAAAEIDPTVANPVYVNFLAVQLRKKGHTLKEGGQEEEALESYRESRHFFEELAALVESQASQGRKNRNLPMVYRQITDISMDLGDTEDAFKTTDQFVNSVMQVYQCRPSDPVMHQVWEYKAAIHAAANDAEGAANARNKALKCKSSVLRARDSSHKSKQRK